jgi:hypothetical protein
MPPPPWPLNWLLGWLWQSAAPRIGELGNYFRFAQLVINNLFVFNSAEEFNSCASTIQKLLCFQ